MVKPGTMPRILNVDDDASGRYATTCLLQREGFEVTEAATGEETLRLAQERPDLILLNVNLPDISGFEVCKRLKADARTSAIPLMQISAISVTNAHKTADLDSGADAYITQPVDPGVLVATVRALLRVHQAERTARDAVKKLQVAFDASRHAVALVDAEGRIQHANRALCVLVGRNSGQLVGQPYESLFESADTATLSKAALGAEDPHPETSEVQWDGRWFQITADPLIDERGQYNGAVRTVVDITGRKEHERERERLLRQFDREHARMEAVLRQMPAGVMIAEAPSGNLVMINGQVESIMRGPFRTGGAFKSYLQYPARRADGRAYRPEEHPLTRTITTGEVVINEEMEFTRADGTRATVLAGSAPVRNREGFIVAGVLTLHDLSERKQLEMELRHSQKMEAMGRLAGGVAHDFNNLLTIIGGYGQMVLDALDPKDAMRHDLEAVMEAATRATQLTRQLLTFSRRQIAQPRVLDINRQIARVNKMLRRVIGEDVKLATNLRADPARIKIDPSQLEQVVLNLIINARDAMPKGGTLTISTASVEEPGECGAPPARPRLELNIADTGSGMDSETQSHLFEPFFTTKGKGKGTGLGLSTVYGIVKQNGGDIFIESEVGRGTSVRIRLPLAEPPQAPAFEPAPRRALHKGHETILVVEDEEEVRNLAMQMLCRQGYSVLEAASGPEALRICRERETAVDLVLTDVIMPGMSGPEMAGQMKTLCPDLKMVFMSGYTDDVIANYGIETTHTLFLHKPFTADALSRTVREALEKGNS